MSIRYFEEGGPTTDPLVGQPAGQESTLAEWAGPYVTNMLGMGQALAESPYEAYTGPLTAGYSAPQTAAFKGIAGLAAPSEQMGAFTPTSFTAQGTAGQYMNPYLEASLAPQINEATRQAQIAQTEQAGRLTKAGAFGGSRQAIMDAELQRNLSQNIADIRGRGYQQAFEQAQQQFNTEQDRERVARELANRYGLDLLKTQADLGAQERGVESEAVSEAKKQFEEERLYPFKSVQFMQSLLQDLPIEAFQRTFIEPSQLSQFSGVLAAIQDYINEYGGKGGSPEDFEFDAGDAIVAEGVGANIPDAGSPDDALNAIDEALNLPG